MDLYNRLKQVSGFNCQLVSLMYVHNYLCYARETKKAQQIVLLDLNQTQKRVLTRTKDSLSDELQEQECNSQLELYRCRQFAIESILESEAATENFKRFVSFKHVFLLGLSEEFLQSETMQAFLKCMVKHKMNPTNLFLVKNCLTRADVTT